MNCILIVSDDNKVLTNLKKVEDKFVLPMEIYKGSKDPLDIMSNVCKRNPVLTVFDDDFINGKSAHLLSSIRSIKKSLDIIFITSNNSIDLGKEISSLGIQYYAIKPILENQLLQSINALITHNVTNNNPNKSD